MEYDIRYGSFTFKHNVDMQPAPAQERFAEHYHTVYELLYFIAGDADFVIQHRLYRLVPHSLLVVKPGELHNLELKSGARYERIVIRFSGADIPELIQQSLDGLEKVYLLKGTYLSEEFFRMDTHAQQVREDMRLLAFQGSLRVILTYLCSGRAPSLRADLINQDIGQLMAYIDSHLTDIQTLEDLCANLHMSRTALKNMFSEQFHTPVYDLHPYAEVRAG